MLHSSMQINYSTSLPPAFTEDALELFVDALHEKLIPIFQTKEQAINMLREDLDPTQCIVATVDDTLVGLIGFKTYQRGFLNPSLNTMIQTYGFFSALWRMMMLILIDRATATDEFYIDGLVVRAGMRGHGIGTTLLQRAEHHAKTHHYSTITLEVIDTNHRAKALYETLGFKGISTSSFPPLNLFFNFHASILMEKPL